MSLLDYSTAISHLHNAQNVLILPSSPPDGDSLGSALALYLVLQKLGKKVTVVSSQPVPDAYHFLPDSQSIESDYEFSNDFIVTVDIGETGFKDLQYEVKDHKVNIIITPEYGEIHPDKLVIDQHGSKFDLIITVDTAELGQLGDVYLANQALVTKVPVLNFDHHPSNTAFGTLNILDPSKASTTMMLTELLQSMDVSLIDADIATLLLAGIITDTGSFQNANTTPEAFDVAAMLIGYGARQQEIIRHIYKTKELHVLRLWGRVLSKIQTDYNYKIVWSQVSQQDFNDTNSKESDIGDIIDELLSNAPEAEVVLLFKELPDGGTQISFRTTTDDVDASAIAAQFGGGGHVRAAGAKIMSGVFTENVENVLRYARQVQGQRLGNNPATTQEPAVLPTQPPAQMGDIAAPASQAFLQPEEPTIAPTSIQPTSAYQPQPASNTQQQPTVPLATMSADEQNQITTEPAQAPEPETSALSATHVETESAPQQQITPQPITSQPVIEPEQPVETPNNGIPQPIIQPLPPEAVQITPNYEPAFGNNVPFSAEPIADLPNAEQPDFATSLANEAAAFAGQPTSWNQQPQQTFQQPEKVEQMEQPVPNQFYSIAADQTTTPPNQTVPQQPFAGVDTFTTTSESTDLLGDEPHDFSDTSDLDDYLGKNLNQDTDQGSDEFTGGI